MAEKRESSKIDHPLANIEILHPILSASKIKLIEGEGGYDKERKELLNIFQGFNKSHAIIYNCMKEDLRKNQLIKLLKFYAL
jgi:hypothetical protein